MRRLSASQWLVIGAAAVCTVLLSFVSTTAPGPEAPAVMQHEGHAHTLEEQVAEARKRLPAEAAAHVNAIEGAIATNRDHVRRGQMYDSLIRFVGMRKEPVLAAWLAEQKAIKNSGSGSDWQYAGERYRSSALFQQDPDNGPALFEAAIRCFGKALELEPKNLDAKVGLGITYVQGSQDPMQGIAMLLEVVEADSTNINAHLALGDFSMQRGAPDKAIARYSAALRLRPDLYALHVSLGDAYKELGDTVNALRHYEEYVKMETDPVVKNNVENEIRKLRMNPPKP